MSWVLAGAACGAMAMLAVVAETEPYITEEGEEEYSIGGYVLLAGGFAVKWIVRKAFRVVRYFIPSQPSPQPVEDDEETYWKAETQSRLNREGIVASNDFELVI